jgi:hypothetical protein
MVHVRYDTHPSTSLAVSRESVYGWYGQLGVLMVYSDWAYFLFSVGFTALLTAKIIFDKYLLKAEAKAAAGTSASTEVEGPAVYKSMA